MKLSNGFVSFNDTKYKVTCNCNGDWLSRPAKSIMFSAVFKGVPSGCPRCNIYKWLEPIPSANTLKERGL